LAILARKENVLKIYKVDDLGFGSINGDELDKGLERLFENIKNNKEPHL